MGVYISDMEMPKDKSEVLIIAIESDGSVFPVRIDGEGQPMVFPNEEMQNKSVPVPPHGRCIDADELKALVYANIALFDSAPGRMGAEQKLVRAWLASMVDDIDDAPTIIPAEEGE